mgnify:CR=1 FL=1
MGDDEEKKPMMEDGEPMNMDPPAEMWSKI